MPYILFLLMFLISWCLTAVLRRYALAHSIMDVPNSRSSHSLSTPRGGGVAIVLSFLLAVLFLECFDYISKNLCLALFGAGAGIAVIGFIDDRGHIAARWRLLGHFGAAAWALFWLGGLPPLIFWGQQPVQLGWGGDIVAVFYLVWLLNLYNFMDGIDGIASAEAICACCGISLLYWLANVGQFPWLSLSLAVSVVGFFLWNFPPAKIFMGDAGSGFLGVTIGILSINAGWISSELLFSWIVLLGVFTVDATFTLVRRVSRAEKPHEAHRSHAYQYASRRHGSHLRVTLAVILINVVWLLPVSVAILLFGLNGPLGIVIAYTPLVVLAVYYQAGAVEHS